ncbi:sigma-E factor negative regulatory protein RseA [Methylohalomonas lacus]|uniref:Sigma-E factor negative regulatory protein RseA n=1 Tax=Methylohalomonas lacus TaxID=398773 RepID=A0AAE3HK16_9GAMM|nr:sigma-E factor negative regulatory protein [Methylohalomonas lacus]MCS3902613.1 sigma-E factor negative regulatory protein RseA [Methylohalomonas lacus]
MNKYEEISIFMDGESGQSAETVLNSFRTDPELLASWRRYHMIGDAMRGQLASDMPIRDLSQRISAALDDEPTVLSPQSNSRRFVQKALKPAAGMAIAASVALVAIVGLRGLDQATSVSSPTAPAVTGVSVNTAPAGDSSFANDPVTGPWQSTQPAPRAPLARTVSTDAAPASQQQGQYGFNSYLINHNEYRANSGVSGSLPYARIVAPSYGDR